MTGRTPHTRPSAQRARIWAGEALDPLAPHPILGTILGLAILGILVPALYLWQGESPRGPLYLSIPLFFLIPILFTSAIGGRRLGALVSVIATLAWDWFFIPPLHTVTVGTARDVVALVVFLIVALLVGQLSNLTRRRSEEALQRAYSSDALYELSLALIARRDLSDVLQTLTARLCATFDLEAAAVLLPDERSGLWKTAAATGDIPLDLSVERSRNMAATVSWVNQSGRTSSSGQIDGAGLHDGHLVRPKLKQARAQFLPLRVDAHPLGVLELVYKTGAVRDASREHLLETFANGAALALEQARLGQEEQQAVVAKETDRLRTALLSSVSHDLRTPLAGIKAASSSLLQTDVQWSEEDRRTFIEDIDSEADRLTRLVSNLLDLSRIEAGSIKADKEWEDVGEMVERVVRRLEPRPSGHTVQVQMQEGLPTVQLDAVQMEQVLMNLLENAAKYSRQGTPIQVSVEVTRAGGSSETMRIAVADRGVGITRSEQTKVFDKFYRVAGTARTAAGTGMGLAIVKGLVEANGGHILLESTPGQGSTFTVVLPLAHVASSSRLPNPALSDAPFPVERVS